jgi:hypothetical protein
MSESIVSDTYHAVWDGDRSQVSAKKERSISYMCQTVWDSDRCQTCASFKSIISDTSQTGSKRN